MWKCFDKTTLWSLFPTYYLLLIHYHIPLRITPKSPSLLLSLRDDTHIQMRYSVPHDNKSNYKVCIINSTLSPTILPIRYTSYLDLFSNFPIHPELHSFASDDNNMPYILHRSSASAVLVAPVSVGKTFPVIRYSNNCILLFSKQLCNLLRRISFPPPITLSKS